MRRWVAALRLTGVGFFVGGCIVLGVAGGLWLDNRLKYEQPIFTVVGLILGIVTAAYGVYRMLQPLMSNRRDKGNG